MKKMRFVALLFMVGALMAACQKDDAKEWEKYYGYSVDEIMGTYTFSYVSSAFEGLTENSYCHICQDAEISVTSYLDSESSIAFKVNCPKATFNKTFTGRPVMTDDGFLIKMSIPSTSEFPDYELTVYVYKNAKGDIRLHGFARHIVYENGIEEGTTIHYVKTVTNYYFDVKKQ